MDLQSQEVIKRLADEHGPDRLLVLLGAPDPEAAEIAAETVVLGDPTYAEEEIRMQIPPEVFEEQIGVMADVLDAAGLSEAVAGMRAKRP
jgi:betaine reductase